MTTPNDIIKGALRKLGVNASETEISDAETADGLEDLNDLGEAYKLFPAVATASSDLWIPREIVGDLKMVLAEKLLPDYPNVQLTPQLQKGFCTAWDNIWRNVNRDIDVKFPNTLPLGSGNQDSEYIWGDRFFKESESLNF